MKVVMIHYNIPILKIELLGGAAWWMCEVVLMFLMD